MKTRAVLLLSVCLAALPGALLAQSGFQNGSFSSPGLPPDWSALELTNGSTFVTGWRATSGFDGSAWGWGEYLNDRSRDPGGHCVELGIFFSFSGLQQQFWTVPNQSYLVSFWLATDPANGPPAVLRVSAAGSSADYQAPPRSGDEHNMAWQQCSFQFTSDNTGMTTLWFGNTYGIAAIDEITVTPEPGTWTLFGLGAIALFWHRRGAK